MQTSSQSRINLHLNNCQTQTVIACFHLFLIDPWLIFELFKIPDTKIFTPTRDVWGTCSRVVPDTLCCWLQERNQAKQTDVLCIQHINAGGGRKSDTTADVPEHPQRETPTLTWNTLSDPPCAMEDLCVTAHQQPRPPHALDLQYRKPLYSFQQPFFLLLYFK